MKMMEGDAAMSNKSVLKGNMKREIKKHGALITDLNY